jgi:hypothetical protein
MIGNSVASDPSLWGEIDASHIPPSCDVGLPTTLVTRLQSVVLLKVSGRLYIPPRALRSILSLASQSPRLTSLSFCSAIDISEDRLISLFRGTKGSFEHVDLSFCHHIGSLPIIALIENHPNLLTLNLSHTSLTDNALLSLYQLQYLTDLSLEGCFNLTRASMSKFLQTSLPPRLSRLNLSYLFTVLGEWLAQLNSNVKFERLDVRYAEHVTKRDIRGLRERWGNGCEVLTTARLETDDEPGWKQYVDEIVKAEVVY